MDEKTRNISVSIGALFFFVLSIWVERSVRPVKFEPALFIAILAACMAIGYLLLKAELRRNAIINACFALGVIGMGVVYGSVAGIIAYLVAARVYNRAGLSLANSLAAASVAYLASHFFNTAVLPVFVLALFGVERVLSGISYSAETIKEAVAPFEELLSYFFAGLTGLSIASGEYFEILLPLVYFVSTAYIFNRRLYLPEAGYFLRKIVDGLDEVVFETPNASREIASLALRMNHGPTQTLEKSAFFSALPWMKFNKTLYRQPENIPAVTEAELFRKAILDVRDTLVELGEKRENAIKITSVYENFDGTGLPDGIEGESIPRESHLVRVAEKYYTLTSWDFSEKPLSDVEAVEAIKAQAGRVYLPEAVESLEKLILPVAEDHEQSENN